MYNGHTLQRDVSDVNKWAAAFACRQLCRLVLMLPVCWESGRNLLHRECCRPTVIIDTDFHRDIVVWWGAWAHVCSSQLYEAVSMHGPVGWIATSTELCWVGRWRRRFVDCGGQLDLLKSGAAVVAMAC
jgi:hypothetical protein